MAEPEGTITVHGEAVVPAEPDELRLRFTVSAVRSGQSEALQDVTARSHQLETLLTELDIPGLKRLTSGLSIREKREWVDDRSVHRGYEAQNSIFVRLDDPSVAGALLEGAVERAQAHVDGPWWHVDSSNPARLEACREAVRDARRKAEAYADGVGLALGAIESIDESTAVPSRLGGHVLSGRAAAAQEIEVETGALDVAASVTVTFAIDR